MIARTLSYGFPFFLIALEWILRDMSDVDFIGPSLLAAGMAQMIDVTEPKSIDPAIVASGAVPAGFSLRKISDERLSYVALFLTFVGIILWALTVYHYNKGASSIASSSVLAGLSHSFLIGITFYLMAMALSELKRRIG